MSRADYAAAWAGRPLGQSALAASPGRHCALCAKRFASAATLAAHLQSARHRHREAAAASPGNAHSPAKTASPAKSPAKKMQEIRAAERNARATGGARGAQALYDVGVQYAQLGQAEECEKCLRQCIAQLPPRSDNKGRIMIEFKARLIVARAVWEDNRGQRELLDALAVMSKRNEPPPVASFQSVPCIEQLDEMRQIWRADLRLDELWSVIAETAREFGARMSAREPSFPAAALLWLGENYDFAAILFKAMELPGLQQEALWRAKLLPDCLEAAALQNWNPHLLKRIAAYCSQQQEGDEELARIAELANAAANWDLAALESMAVAPVAVSPHRALARQVMTMLAATEYS